MKSELEETRTLADIGAVLELQHPDGSRAFLKLAELVNAPNTLRAVWGSVVGVRNPAIMAEQLIDGATAPTEKGEAMIDEHQRIEQEEAAWAQVARGELVATQRAEDAERNRIMAEAAEHARRLEPTPEERAATKIRMENRWLSFISKGRRRKQQEAQAARHSLEMAIIQLHSDSIYKAKEVAEAAAQAYRDEIGRKIQRLNAAYDRGEDWRKELLR